VSHSSTTPPAAPAGTAAANQLDYQRNRPFGMSCHAGINTVYGRELNDGMLDPSALDCRQWAVTAKQAGAAHIILTAKHDDGFCLWHTEPTGYSVRPSPWRGGEDDVFTMGNQRVHVFSAIVMNSLESSRTTRTLT